MTSLTRFDRALLLVGLAAILGGLAWLVVAGAPIERALVAAVFEDEGDRVVFRPDVEVIRSSLDPRAQVFQQGLSLAWAGLAMLAIALRRANRRLGFRVDRRVTPLLVPLVVGLVALPLVHHRFEGVLIDLDELLGGEPHFVVSTCYHSLLPCSRLQALHGAWNAAIVLACVATAIAFVREAPRAWRGGEHGVVLSRGWSRFAVALFVAGAAALVLTMPHAADREQAASTCDDDRWHDETPDTTASEIRGPVAVHEQAFDDSAWLLVVQVDAGGWVSAIPHAREAVEYLVPAQFDEWLGRENGYRLAAAEARGEPARELAVALFVDRRASPAGLAPHLQVAADHGVERIVLLGRAEVEGESALVGPWVRRSLCPVGELRLDATAWHSLGDFDDIAALQVTLRNHDGPFPIRPDATPHFTRDHCADGPDDEPGEL